MGIRGYVGGIAVVTAALLLSALWVVWGPAAGGWYLALFAIVGLFPAMDAAQRR